MEVFAQGEIERRSKTQFSHKACRSSHCCKVVAVVVVVVVAEINVSTTTHLSCPQVVVVQSLVIATVV